MNDRSKIFDRAWRSICEDESLARVRRHLSINNLRDLINRVLDAVSAEMEQAALDAKYDELDPFDVARAAADRREG